MAVPVDATIPPWVAFLAPGLRGVPTKQLQRATPTLLPGQPAERPFFDPKDRVQARYEMLRMAFTGAATKMEAADIRSLPAHLLLGAKVSSLKQASPDWCATLATQRETVQTEAGGCGLHKG
jgi:hypothetical protein